MYPLFIFFLQIVMDRTAVVSKDFCNSSSFHTTVNNSSSEHGITTQDPFVNVTVLIEIYCLPVICVFGLVGNTLSSITFFRNPLRKTSCNLYLAARSISDNGFLLALLLTWISGVFDLKLGRVKGICATIVFLTYICGCMSVWFVVFLTLENYVRICHPFCVKSVCSKRLARLLTSGLCVFALAVYNTPLWISNSDCSHNYKYHEITQALVYTDTLLTLVIPSVLITILMTAITFRLIKMFQRRQRLRRSAEMKGRSIRDEHPVAKVTKMLFIVSLTFFVLNIPSHIIRMYILLNSFIKGQSKSPNIERAIQTLFQQLYYLSFSVNVIIYFIFGRNFRVAFKKTFFCKVSGSSPDRTSAEAVNLVHTRLLRKRFSLPVILEADQNDYLAIPSDVMLRPVSVS